MDALNYYYSSLSCRPEVKQFITRQLTEIEQETKANENSSWMPSPAACNAFVQCFVGMVKIFVAVNRSQQVHQHGLVNVNQTTNNYHETEASRQAKEDERDAAGRIAAGAGGAVIAGAGVHFSASYLHRIFDLNEAIAGLKSFEHRLNFSASMRSLNNSQWEALNSAINNRKEALNIERDYTIAKLALLIGVTVSAVFTLIAAIAWPAALAGAAITTFIIGLGLIFTWSFEAEDSRISKRNRDAKKIFTDLLPREIPNEDAFGQGYHNLGYPKATDYEKSTTYIGDNVSDYKNSMFANTGLATPSAPNFDDREDLV